MILTLVTVFAKLELRSFDSSCFNNDTNPISIYQLYYPPIPDNLYITNSFFFDSTSRAISVNMDRPKNLVLEFSTFTNVTSPESNGAIYYYHTGASTMRFVCSSNCYSQLSNGKFQFGSIFAGKQNNLTVDYFSCQYFTPDSSREHNINFQYGSQKLTGLNISKGSGAYCYHSIYMSLTFNSYLKFSTIESNRCTYYYGFCIESNHFFQNDISHINYINNSVGHYSYSNIYVSGDSITSFTNSVFGLNGGYLFYSAVSANGNFVVQTCSIAHPHSGYVAYGSRIIVNAYTITNTIITVTLGLSHYNTAYCPALIPADLETISEMCAPATPAQTLPPPPTECFQNSDNPIIQSFIAITNSLLAQFLLI